MLRIWLVRSVLFALFLALPAAGAEKVVIQEWDLPTKGSFPHDPAAGPDGSLWYTGMASNTIGRLDPSTGTVREYRLKTPDSGPHGITADRAGNIWFTANYRGYIGKLDPKTGQISEYPLTDKAARDPHTLVFDRNGILWFTVQNGNFVGRLDPATGAVALKRSPTPDSRPYGIVVDPQGVPFFCEFGTNKIGRIDPASMQISEYVLPEGSRPRRLAVGRNGAVFYTDHQRGYLGRLDTRTGVVKEWPSPGGRSSQPYGIAATPDGTIWYSESGVKPNTIVRFDPTAERFVKWDIPSGGGVVRHMVGTADGEIYIACSGKNKVGIVRTEKRTNGGIP